MAWGPAKLLWSTASLQPGKSQGVHTLEHPGHAGERKQQAFISKTKSIVKTSFSLTPF